MSQFQWISLLRHVSILTFTTFATRLNFDFHHFVPGYVGIRFLARKSDSVSITLLKIVNDRGVYHQDPGERNRGLITVEKPHF
jgi:hypothetical protein